MTLAKAAIQNLLICTDFFPFYLVVFKTLYCGLGSIELFLTCFPVYKSYWYIEPEMEDVIVLIPEQSRGMSCTIEESPSVYSRQFVTRFCVVSAELHVREWKDRANY